MFNKQEIEMARRIGISHEATGGPSATIRGRKHVSQERQLQSKGLGDGDLVPRESYLAVRDSFCLPSQNYSIFPHKLSTLGVCHGVPRASFGFQIECSTGKL